MILKFTIISKLHFLVTVNHDFIVNHIYRNLLVLVFLGIKVANCCQEVLNPISSYWLVFTRLDFGADLFFRGSE